MPQEMYGSEAYDRNKSSEVPTSQPGVTGAVGGGSGESLNIESSKIPLTGGIAQPVMSNNSENPAE